MAKYEKPGQPTKYRPEYCEKVVLHMAKGLSYETFAVDCDVCVDTLYHWEKTHPEFSEAKKKAFLAGMKFWETMGINGATGDNPSFNATAWIYNMKCRFRKHWGDTQTTTHVIDDRRETIKIKESDLNSLLISDGKDD